MDFAELKRNSINKHRLNDSTSEWELHSLKYLLKEESNPYAPERIFAIQLSASKIINIHEGATGMHWHASSKPWWTKTSECTHLCEQEVSTSPDHWQHAFARIVLFPLA